MPGDAEPHPKLAEVARNPFPGWSVLGISRALREGKITDPVLERKARAYLAQYQRFTGDVVYDPRNHVEGESYVSDAPGNNVRRADPFDSGRNFKWGGPRVR